MRLDLSDDETAALLRELDHMIDGDRFPLSPRILTLKPIRPKLRPEPPHEPLPPPKHYEPLRVGATAVGLPPEKAGEGARCGRLPQTARNRGKCFASESLT
jgi:hypothetical protein